jgi:hypothetical protein
VIVMTEDVVPPAMPENARCGWCSAPLPDASAANCPSCGAALLGEGETQVPGVTALDPTAIIRGARPIPRQRSRLLAWISGDDVETDDGAPAAPGSLAPPPAEVAAEMLRLEIEAELADLEAEAESMAAEAEIEARETGRVTAAGNDTAAEPEIEARETGRVTAAGNDTAAEPVNGTERDVRPEPQAPPEPQARPERASPTESSEHTTPA